MLDNAKFIAHKINLENYACPVFKRDFSLKGKIKSAYLEITSLGTYYAEINGARVGDFIFAPGWTSLKRVQAQKYDVTKMLRESNEIKVSVSKGWFQGRINHLGRLNKEMYDALIASLVITYADGSREEIVTDKSWVSAPSKITMSDIYDGEHFDANLDEVYTPCIVKDYDKKMIEPQQGEKIVEQERILPLSIFKTPRGETVVDFGQNLTGYFEFEVDAKKGEVIDLSFAEVLDKDGNFYTENYRSAKCEFKYICKDGKQSYKPRHAFYGFRYIRVNSFVGEVTENNLRAIVVHSDIKRTGYLESSSPLLNQLFKNIAWGQKGNFLDVPTDCPQRDERMGWTGDAQVFARTASYNFNVEKFFTKWLRDLALDQTERGSIPHVIPQAWDDNETSAAWGEACTVCPWQMYLTYGNKQILKNQYASMCKYVRYIGKISKNRYLWTGCWHFGDWLGLDAPYGSYKGSSNEDFIASVFYAYSTLLVVKAGKALGKNVSKYEALYEKIIDKTRKAFKTYKTQTECVLALYFDIATDKKAVADQLATMIKENGTRLQTGFVGTPYLLHALSQNGYTELAYDLLLQEQFPSWLYSVKQGATTIWEHWDGMNDKGEFWSKDMNSFNHYAYGSVADWVYGVACGIQTVEERPGFEEIIIAPQPSAKLEHLSARIDTVRGTVSSKWYYKDGKVRYEITTPSKATIIIDGVRYEVEKGSYIF